MKNITLILELMRWPNLLFIAFTQYLFYYYVFKFSFDYYNTDFATAHLNKHLFILLMAASLFIAAAGYVINDYFDIKIDQINKPEKVIIGRFIPARQAFFLYLILSSAGMILSIYIAIILKNYTILTLNTLAILALYFYSSVLKKKLISGNLVISILAAWVILVLTVAEYQDKSSFDGPFYLIFRIAVTYGGFAFLITFIREVVKDIEDIKGDQINGCSTLPIVFGTGTAKKVVRFSLIFLIALIMLLLTPLFYSHNWLIGGYCIFFIIRPLLRAFRKVNKSETSDQFHNLSSILKRIMLTGIVSMIFFSTLSL